MTSVSQSWRPPGYRRARQASYNARYWLSAWREFMRAGRESGDFARTLDALRRHRVLYEPKLPRYWGLHQLASAFVAPGTAIAEFGVYRGATARILAEVAAERAPGAELHLFDTFAGMPGDTDYSYDDETYRPGDLGDVDEGAVRALVEEVEGVRPILHVGTFAETLPGAAADTLSLTHVDADLYDSIMEACEWAYARTRAGGAIVFDDFADSDCPGAARAIDDFFRERAESPVVLPTGQALVVKL
jgi:O-methyltransferase